MIRFGTDGWRDKVTEGFTSGNLARVAQAVSVYCKKNGLRKIVVGYDTRKHSRGFAELVSRVLSGNGVKAFLLSEPAPTPVAVYSIRFLSADGALIITASHNPPEYSGIKFVPGDCAPAGPEVTGEIEKCLSGVSRVFESEKLVEEVDTFEEYVKEVLSRISVRGCGLKVVVDARFGTCFRYLPFLLEKLGCEVRVINSKKDPSFGGGKPDVEEKDLKVLVKTVLDSGSDLGLANDGDADRLAAVDEKGRYYPANDIASVLAFLYLDDFGLGGTIVRTVPTTSRLDRIALDHSCRVLETPVGFKYVGGLMKKGSGFLLGVEESGGMSFGEKAMLGAEQRAWIPEKDGVFSALKIVEAVDLAGKGLSRVFSELSKRYPGCSLRTQLECGVDPKRVVDYMAKNPPNALLGKKVVDVLSGRDLENFNGVKLVFEDFSWLVYRPSGTEPVFRVYAESFSKPSAEKLLSEGRKLFVKALGSV